MTVVVLVSAVRIPSRIRILFNCAPNLFFSLSEHNIYSRISYEVIIIEDNSPDGTLEVAQQLQVTQKLRGK